MGSRIYATENKEETYSPLTGITREGGGKERGVQKLPKKKSGRSGKRCGDSF